MGRHAAVAIGGEGVRREAGPQDESVRPGVAGRDPQGEGVLSEPLGGSGPAARQGAGGERQRERSRGAEHRASPQPSGSVDPTVQWHGCWSVPSCGIPARAEVLEGVSTLDLTSVRVVITR
ncbi:hypothetical protein CU044_2740 [Streptomyces sp. L-9-10]|nr:hypothetical protein CU044_2740 [Streptomyces sp. L-9-10]